MLKYDNTDYKKKIAWTITIFAIAILVILVLINLSSISNFISGILSVAAPIIIGGAIAYILNPILKFLEFVVFKKVKNKTFVRAISLVLTYVFAIFIVALIIAVVIPRFAISVIDLVQNYNNFLERAISFISNIATKITANFDFVTEAQVTNLIKNVFTKLADFFGQIGEYLISYGMTLIVTLKNVILGLFISIYILISKERLYAQATKGARAIFSDKFYRNCMRYLRITNVTFGRFFIGKIFDSAIVAIITMILLLVFKMQYCILISMIVGILNIIPFFGIIVAIVCTSFIVLIATPEKFLIFLIIMIVVEQIETNFIAPKILGNSAGISSLGVIVAVMIMGHFFGVLGMIFSVPVFAIAISIIKELIENKLSRKRLPLSITDYYTDPDYSSESEEHKTVSRMIYDTFLSKIIKKYSPPSVHEDTDDDLLLKEDNTGDKTAETTQAADEKNTVSDDPGDSEQN